MSMDLKAQLSCGDLFVSYWLDQSLIVVVGDHQAVLSVEVLPASEILGLVTEFEEQVTDLNRYAFFFAEQYRPAVMPQQKPKHSMPELLALLGSKLITPKLQQCAVSGNYRRLILFPDGILNALPIHFMIFSCVGNMQHEIFPDGILYAPSASAYAYACAKRREIAPRQAAILIGDENDPDIIREAENAARKMPCPASFIRTWAELEHVSAQTDILYIATHGESPGKVASDNLDRSSWTLLFDHGFLKPQDFFSDRIKLPKGTVVALSACSVGHMMAKQIHEIDGLVQALFFAGAATVLAARWPILYESAEAVFTGTLERVYQSQLSFGAAFHQSISAARARDDLKQLMVGPQADTFFWGPFALFGCGN